jgi:hypothetical protein
VAAQRNGRGLEWVHVVPNVTLTARSCVALPGTKVLFLVV